MSDAAEAWVGSSEDEIVQQISRMLESLNRHHGPIRLDTDIARDLNLDSLAIMDLMMELEEKFDVSIPLNLVPEIRTVADLAVSIDQIRKGA